MWFKEQNTSITIKMLWNKNSECTIIIIMFYIVVILLRCLFFMNWHLTEILEFIVNILVILYIIAKLNIN